MMIKKLVCATFLIYLCFTCIAQSPKEVRIKLSKSSQGNASVELQLWLAMHYLDIEGRDKKNLDSARYFLTGAQSSLNQSHNAILEEKLNMAQALFFWKTGRYKEGGIIFRRLAVENHKRRNYLEEARVWDKFGGVIDFDNPLHQSLLDTVFGKAYNIHKTLGDELETAHALGRLANVNLTKGRYDSAQSQMIEVTRTYERLKYPQTFYGYYMLAETYYRQNQLQKELYYRIKCLENFEDFKDGKPADRMAYNFKLGEAFFRLREYQKAIPYFQKSIDLGLALKEKILYYHFVNNLVDCYSQLKQYDKGLSYLQRAKKQFPATGDDVQRLVLSTELRLYNHLKKYELGERIIGQFRQVYQKRFAEVANSPNYHAVNTLVYIYEPLLKYYTIKKRWSALEQELFRLDLLPKKNMTVLSKLSLNTYQYKVDSVNGNFSVALSRLQWINSTRDSLGNLERARQVNELEAKYLSVKKDKTIQTLNSEAQAQKSKMEKVNAQRNATLAGILLAIAFGSLMYFAYRSKHRSNAKLLAKQNEINVQNMLLSELVGEKDMLLRDKDDLLDKQEGLLDEKEWLLKEVHHRVKNNLQIIMSLLYTQSAYLKNNDAIEAIKDSQNRIQAISIIHQKLYNRAGIASTSLSDYVNELVSYLSNSYGLSQRNIRFKQNVIQQQVDIAQAVPIGLILNESITNSIKYAFDEAGGLISICAVREDEKLVRLSIKDNGRGFPSGFDSKNSSSLGMEMMAALSKQLGGTIEIKNDAGVSISMLFPLEKI